MEDKILYDDFEMESRAIEYGFYCEDCFDMSDVYDSLVPEADLELVDDLPF